MVAVSLFTPSQNTGSESNSSVTALPSTDKAEPAEKIKQEAISDKDKSSLKNGTEVRISWVLFLFVCFVTFYYLCFN